MRVSDKLKYITSGIILGSVLFSGVSYAATKISASILPLKYSVDGVAKAPAQGTNTINYNGQLYMPVNYVAQLFGKSVVYSSANGTVQFNKPAPAAPQVKAGQELLTGTIAFEYDKKPEFMSKYKYFGSTTNQNNRQYQTNLFGAPDAQVIIKDETGKIIGNVRTNTEGKFTAVVEKKNFYQLEVLFNNLKKTAVINASDLAKNVFDVGYLEYSQYKLGETFMP